jgi:hypothetical protein
MNYKVENFISTEPLLFVCPYCRRPNFLSGNRDASDTLWGLHFCPQCGAPYKGLMGRDSDVRCSASWLVERIAMEIDDSVRYKPSSLDVSGLQTNVDVLSGEHFEHRREKRHGLLLDGILWVIVSAVSGVVGGLSYDAIRTLVKFALSQGWAPKLSGTRYITRGSDSRPCTVTLTEEQVEVLLMAASEYAKRRLSLAITEVNDRRDEVLREGAIRQLPPQVKGLLGMEGGITPLEVVYVDQKPKTKPGKKQRSHQRDKRRKN